MMFAIGHKDGKLADLLCTGDRDAKGVLHFEVVNGRWGGTLTPEGVLKANGRATEHEAVLLWEGEVPREHDTDYNTALLWIREQIA